MILFLHIFFAIFVNSTKFNVPPSRRNQELQSFLSMLLIWWNIMMEMIGRIRLIIEYELIKASYFWIYYRRVAMNHMMSVFMIH